SISRAPRSTRPSTKQDERSSPVRRKRALQKVGVAAGLPPLLAGQARPRRLFIPVPPHVDVPATRAALCTYYLAREQRHFNIVGILRHVDQALMSASVDKASGDKVMHVEMAHVA